MIFIVFELFEFLIITLINIKKIQKQIIIVYIVKLYNLSQFIRSHFLLLVFNTTKLHIIDNYLHKLVS